MDLLKAFQTKLDSITARLGELDGEKAVLLDRQAQLQAGVLALTPFTSGTGDGKPPVAAKLSDDVQAIVDAADILIS